MTRWRAAVAGLLTAAATAADAGSVDLPLQVGGAYSVPVKSLKQIRTAGTVPQQLDYSCGSAALATLLGHHYGDPVSEAQVFDAMFEQGEHDKIRRQGFSLLDMKRFLARRGYAADGFEASLDSLAGAALPAIALINERGFNHFVVVKGIAGGRVLVGDPAAGTRTMSTARFEALRASRVLFVVTNRGEQARFNEAADWAAVPAAPVATGNGMALASGALPKLGSTDF